MSQTAAELNLAILDCAKHCVSADDPMDCVHSFAAQLSAKGWDKADIEAFSDGALGVIAQLTGNRDLMHAKRRMEG